MAGGGIAGSTGGTGEIGSISVAPTEATASGEEGASGEPERPDTAPIVHAPDGTPIDPAGFLSGKKRKGRARAIEAFLGAVGRLIRRWLPEPPDDDVSELPPQPNVRELAPSSPQPSSGGAQTQKNKKAQALEPRVRSDLSDDYINADGSLRWPDNNGAIGPEKPETLQPGQVVDKYGEPNGYYLSPQGTSFEARSLPYDASQTPSQSFRVSKPFGVKSSSIAPWFDEPGGGIQFRSDVNIRDLVALGHLSPIR